MKLSLVAAAVFGFVVTAASADTTVLESDIDKLSYSIGIDLGKNIKKQGIDINASMMAKGMQDGINDTAPLLTEQQMKDVLSKFQKDLMSKRAAEFDKIAKDNQSKGDTFLAETKSKAGVIALASGLQYKVLTNGAGAKPGKDATVTVEYTGKLITG